MADAGSTSEASGTSAVSSGAIVDSTAAPIAAADHAEWREALVIESIQILTSATAWSDAYRGRAGFFQSVGTYLALVSALVATIAGGTGLALTSEAGGIIALVAAGLAAISTALGPGARTAAEQIGAIANTTLADAARVFGNTVAPYGSEEDVLVAFRKLLDQRDEVVKKAPIEANRTLKKVEKALRRAENSKPLPVSYSPPGARSGQIRG